MDTGSNSLADLLSAGVPLHDYSLTGPRRNRMAGIAAAWLGCSPNEVGIVPATGGRSTPVYRVTLGPLTAYLRLSETSEASLGPEALAHEVVLSHGARVPAVIGYEPFDPVLERSIMLTTAIPGAALKHVLPADPGPVLVAAGADMARINRVPVDGFGWMRRNDPLPTRLSAPHAAWNAFAAELTSYPLDDWFDPAMRSRLAELARIQPDDPERAVLAHGDFDTSHIFALNGLYTGIIDFGEMRGAEPSFDLGHLALHDPDAVTPVLQGYTSVTPLPPEFERQIAASAIRIGWFRLTQSSASANSPYAATLVAGMTRIADSFPMP